MNLLPVEEREFARYLSYYDFSSYIQDKTFLITGAKGICGSGVIQWLLAENALHNANTKIIASTRNPAAIPSYAENQNQISFCQFGKEVEACQGVKIDYIIHMASSTQNSFFQSNPVEALRVIVDATESMLEIASRNPGCSMLYLSSEEVYGITNSDMPVSEQYVGAIDSLNTRSCYPLGKKVAELLCFTYAAEYGTNVKIIRPSSIQGLFQRYGEERLVNEILRCIIEKKNLEMKSAGYTKKCIIYTLDVVSAIFTVLFKGETGQAYNATNPNTFMTVRDLAANMFKKFAPDITAMFPKADASVVEGYLPKRSIIQDISKLKKLGWEPRTNLEQIFAIDIQRFTK